ncbi:MAG: hypothetical protein F6J93_39110 [Oscillatoria sp. SIO1A7]|nr:hypothetical protein [Oscillatoria sp. SIO1A7]
MIGEGCGVWGVGCGAEFLAREFLAREFLAREFLARKLLIVNLEFKT